MQLLVGIIVNPHHGLVEVVVVSDLVTIVVIGGVIGVFGRICQEDVADNHDGVLGNLCAQTMK